MLFGIRADSRSERTSEKHSRSYQGYPIQSECLHLLSKMSERQRKFVLMELLSQQVGRHEVHPAKTQLTNRETQVLVLVANGYSRQEIALTLEISPNTAARHISNIYNKLHISTVAEATTYAIANGLVTI